MTAKNKWTDEQRAAIRATEDTLLVANAGTGKTTTIVQKILWLLGFDVDAGIPRVDQPCKLEEIAAITFTEKAAYDLKRKLREELEKREGGEALLWELEQASLGTIHSFCGQLLRDHALRLGIDPTFGVLDEQEARLRHDQILKDVIIELLQQDDEDVGELVRSYKLEGLGDYGTGTLDLARTAFRDMRWRREAYEGWCNGGVLDIEARMELYGINPGDERAIERCRGLCRIAQTALDRWRAEEISENIRDFDSLILDARDLLLGDAAQPALEGIRRRYRVLIIDEFQDTDDAQRDIAYAIARNEERPQLFLVGDPKQSIYHFRGANIAVWNQVQADFSQHGEPLTLTQNFRSDPAVIEFANAASSAAIESSGAAVEAAAGSRVAYSELRPGRTSQAAGHVEWRVPDGDNASDKRVAAGQHLADRIAALVGKQDIIDPESGEPRKCKYSDIAVLYRARTDLNLYQDELRRAGIPYYENSPLGLAERQEILDILNLLRLLANPFDDLRAFAFLRSPFVGLRDEVLARIKMSDLGGSYLNQARRYLESGEWFAAPEHARVHEVERVALKNGLALFERANRLEDRVPIDELLTDILEASGYRNHLQLLPGYREACANIDSFVRVTEQFRDQTLGGFLQIWDDRDPSDPGVPQAQLYSRADDVVTFSTIHSAKGLEWPVVFLINVDTTFKDKSTHDFWSDPLLGPIVGPKTADRGPRALVMVARNAAENVAEEARLMYVAVTRARDKLYLVGCQPERGVSYATWLGAGVSACGVPVVTDEPDVVEVPAVPPIDLKLLDAVQPYDAPSKSIERPPHRWMTSATEMMSRLKDEKIWRLMYLHGAEPSWMFAPSGKPKALPENVRGTIIHGVLERMSEDVEIAQVLEETIGELATPELEMVLAPGSQYRLLLEAEIARVVSSDDWKWYVDGEHHREVPFLYLAGEREWYVGAFDLYRPDGWVVDFKTHQVSEAAVNSVAAKYQVQMDLYRRVAGIVGPVRTQLHFTHPGVVVEIA